MENVLDSTKKQFFTLGEQQSKLEQGFNAADMKGGFCLKQRQLRNTIVVRFDCRFLMGERKLSGATRRSLFTIKTLSGGVEGGSDASADAQGEDVLLHAKNPSALSYSVVLSELPCQQTTPIGFLP